MWSYYGAKTNVIKYYPPPKYGRIMEPFAGSARYALEYFDREITLIDKYEDIIKIWKWLQKCSPKDILSLPSSVKHGQKLSDLKWDCEEQLLLMGFIVGCGAERPRNLVGYRKTTDRPNHVNFNLKKIAANLFKIKHWEILYGDYTESEDIIATWFIDPPYEFGGQAYVMSNRNINFKSLAEWCRNRGGQVIVCENSKATWMDFYPLKKQRGSQFSSTEVIWTNEKSSYNITANELFL